MRRPLARATVASIATMLVVSLMSTLPARAEPDASEGSDPQEQQEFDALALAEQSGERVEIPGLTDEKTQHFANPDGSLTAEVSAVPRRRFPRRRHRAGPWHRSPPAAAPSWP